MPISPGTDARVRVLERPPAPTSARLVVVSHRLPIAVDFAGPTATVRRTVGGLVSGVEAFLRARGSESAPPLWIGWPGTTSGAEQRAALKEALAEEPGIVPVFLEADVHQRFYDGFANRALWPLCHTFPRLVAPREPGVGGLPRRQPGVLRRDPPGPEARRRRVGARLPADAAPGAAPRARARRRRGVLPPHPVPGARRPARPARPVDAGTPRGRARRGRGRASTPTTTSARPCARWSTCSTWTTPAARSRATAG